MKDLLVAIAFVAVFNATVFLTEVAIADINPDSPLNYFNYNGSDISAYDADGNYNLVEFDPNNLPNAQSSVNTDGGYYTDIFTTMKNWLLQTTGLKYVIGFINAVPLALKAWGLPIEAAFAIGYVWHVVAFLLVVYFMKS